MRRKSKFLFKTPDKELARKRCRIFSSNFSRVTTKRGAVKRGLGLGLSIVKILAEKHSGTIKAESAGIGQGATFTVTLPLVRTQKLSQRSKRKNQLRKRKASRYTELIFWLSKTIPIRAKCCILFLEQSGADVQSAESAAQAMTLLHEATGNLPDVIVSDLAMPDRGRLFFDRSYSRACRTKSAATFRRWL